LIIERAGLKAVDASNPTDLTHLPKGKTTYVWNQSGRLAAA
jgi:YD repeat-containing protein